MKTCGECKNAIFQDTGYSNYSVDGSDFICSLRKHPDGDFDRWYGTDDRLKFAEQCDSFDHGEPVEMDIEQDNLAHLTPEQIVVWKRIPKKW